MTKRWIFFGAAIFFIGSRAFVGPFNFDSLFEIQPQKKAQTKIFHGLQFAIDEHTTCAADVHGDLICEIKKPRANIDPMIARMIFHLTTRASSCPPNQRARTAPGPATKTVCPSNGGANPISVPLLMRARRLSWQKEFSSLNQYVERSAVLGKFSTRVQQAHYIELDNILLTVLIRAFDVVIDKSNIISITTKCDVRHWPDIKKITDKIESSFVRVTKSRFRQSWIQKD